MKKPSLEARSVAVLQYINPSDGCSMNTKCILDYSYDADIVRFKASPSTGSHSSAQTKDIPEVSTKVKIFTENYFKNTFVYNVHSVKMSFKKL